MALLDASKKTLADLKDALDEKGSELKELELRYEVRSPFFLLLSSPFPLIPPLSPSSLPHLDSTNNSCLNHVARNDPTSKRQRKARARPKARRGQTVSFAAADRAAEGRVPGDGQREAGE